MNRTDEKAKQRALVGKVVSDKMNKSITVLVERKLKHPLYGKYIKKSTKFIVHDETNAYKIGDEVSIKACRPISKTKTYTVIGKVNN